MLGGFNAMPHLTDEERQSLESCSGGPIYIIDSKTNARYALVRAELYEQFKAVFDEEFDPRAAYPLVQRVMAEDDANDPSLASYQDFPAGGAG